MIKPLIQLAAVLIFLTGCQPEEQTIEMEKAPIQQLDSEENGLSISLREVTDSELTVVIQNGRNIDFTYGRPFRIEQRIDNAWYVLPFKEDGSVFEDIKLLAGPRKQTIETVSLSQLADPLVPGDYRIVKSFSAFSINEQGAGVDGEAFWLAAPFKKEATRSE